MKKMPKDSFQLCKKSFDDGVEAYKCGLSDNDNPHKAGLQTPQRRSWFQGFYNERIRQTVGGSLRKHGVDWEDQLGKQPIQLEQLTDLKIEGKDGENC